MAYIDGTIIKPKKTYRKLVKLTLEFNNDLADRYINIKPEQIACFDCSNIINKQAIGINQSKVEIDDYQTFNSLRLYLQFNLKNEKEAEIYQYLLYHDFTTIDLTFDDAKKLCLAVPFKMTNERNCNGWVNKKAMQNGNLHIHIVKTE